MTELDILRAILGSVFLLLVPGLVWSFILFDRPEINWVERIIFSIGLSLALVPVSIFLANRYLDVQINLQNAALTILVLSVLPAPWAYFKHRRRN